MTYQALNTAITGLRAAQAQLSTISNNVSNATTPGYNRQIVPQQTQVLRETGTTVGVLTQQAIRTVDMNLQRDLWTQVSASSMQSVQINYLQQIQNFNGPPDKEFSIAAKLAEMRDSFSALSDIPDDVQALEATVYSANIVADKFNDYAELLTTLRNDTQGDLQSSVNNVNNLLEEITNINIQIRSAENFGNSVASLQDQRDIAIKSLTEEMDISFFERADGVLVVQTREGLELAGDVAHSLRFESVPIGANQFYPQSASGLVVVNTTNNRETTTDITERVIGGKIGGLIELRDEVLPSYHAQLDELAFQTAFRFQQQGLELFTDQNGIIPANTAPDPDTLPLPTPVPYVDFARVIQVNRDIVDDPTLLQSGTYNSDVAIPSGDNAQIRRVLEFAFGEVEYQEAAGTVDLVNIGGAADLQEWLGLSDTNQLVTGIDFTSFTQIDDGDPLTTDETQLIDSLQELFPGYPANSQFELAIGGTLTTIDLSVAAAIPINGTTVNNAGDQLLQHINDRIITPVHPSLPAGPLPATATLNNYGQIVIESTESLTIDANGALTDPMGASALGALGISEGFFPPESPSFTVQVGNNDPYTITIERGDTITELEAKLTYNPATGEGIPGLFVEVDPGTGTLTLRPGVDDSNWGPIDTAPLYGGDITITSSPFTSTLVPNSNPALTNGINVVSALFGNFSGTGVNLIENSPVTNIGYSFDIANGSTSTTNFRNQNLGPNAGISTGIFSATNLLDYAQKVIDETSQDYIQAQSAFDNEDTLRSILQREFSDDSGVNIDEEMSNLIVVQTAYAAAARTITAADEMFQELINSIRR